MAAVSELIVREFFELNGFLVRQHRKFVAPNRSEKEQIDFFVHNPQPRSKSDSESLPFELRVGDLPVLSHAIVVVKGWHTDTFSPGLLANAPEIFRFLQPEVFHQAAKASGWEEKSISRLLVVPSLPHAEEGRRQSIEMLKAKGVDGVILFNTILANLLDEVEVNRNYQKSDLLQILRILKNYDFIREPQLELFRSSRPRRSAPDSKKQVPTKTSPSPDTEG